MVRSFAFGVLLAGLIWSRTAGAQQPGPSIGVYMDFDTAPVALVMQSMKDEVEAILKPTGLAVGWRFLKENRGTEAFAGLVVLRFRGKCKAESGNNPGTPVGSVVTLGTSLVADGRVLPFSEVECEQIRKAVPYTGSSACMQERQSALGRAMGRVVAHELYHVLAGTAGHAAGGLAKSTQSLRDLVWGSLRFDSRDAAAIRRGVLPLE